MKPSLDINRTSRPFSSSLISSPSNWSAYLHGARQGFNLPLLISESVDNADAPLYCIHFRQQARSEHFQQLVDNLANRC